MNIFKHLARRKDQFEFKIRVHSVENLSGDDQIPVFCRATRGKRVHDTKLELLSRGKVVWLDESFSFVGTLYGRKGPTKGGIGTDSTVYDPKMVSFRVEGRSIGGGPAPLFTGSVDISPHASATLRSTYLTVPLESKRKRGRHSAEPFLSISIESQSTLDEESRSEDGSSDDDARLRVRSGDRRRLRTRQRGGSTPRGRTGSAALPRRRRMSLLADRKSMQQPKGFQPRERRHTTVDSGHLASLKAFQRSMGIESLQSPLSSTEDDARSLQKHLDSTRSRGSSRTQNEVLSEEVGIRCEEQDRRGTGDPTPPKPRRRIQAHRHKFSYSDLYDKRLIFASQTQREHTKKATPKRSIITSDTLQTSTATPPATSALAAMGAATKPPFEKEEEDSDDNTPSMADPVLRGLSMTDPAMLTPSHRHKLSRQLSTDFKELFASNGGGGAATIDDIIDMSGPRTPGTPGSTPSHSRQSSLSLVNDSFKGVGNLFESSPSPSPSQRTPERQNRILTSVFPKRNKLVKQGSFDVRSGMFGMMTPPTTSGRLASPSPQGGSYDPWSTSSPGTGASVAKTLAVRAMRPSSAAGISSRSGTAGRRATRSATVGTVARGAKKKKKRSKRRKGTSGGRGKGTPRSTTARSFDKGASAAQSKSGESRGVGQGKGLIDWGWASDKKNVEYKDVAMPVRPSLTPLAGVVDRMVDRIIEPALLDRPSDSKENSSGQSRAAFGADRFRRVRLWTWNTIPVMPCLVMRCLMHCKAFQKSRMWVLEETVAAIRSCLGRVQGLSETIGGLANVIFLVHLLVRYAEKKSCLKTKDGVAAEAMARIAARRLLIMGEEIVVELRHAFHDMLPPPDIKSLFPSAELGLECPAVDVFLLKCQAILSLLKSHYIMPSVRSQFLRQIFRIFVSHVSNGLLQDKANATLCNQRGGMGLKIVLANIDGWCDEVAERGAAFRDALQELEPIRDICNVLLLGGAIREKPVRALNFPQLQCLADYYNAGSERKKRRILPEDLEAVRTNRNSSPLLRSGAGQLYMDPKRPAPISFEVQIGKISVSSIPPPEAVKVVTELGFLLRAQAQDLVL